MTLVQATRQTTFAPSCTTRPRRLELISSGSSHFGVAGGELVRVRPRQLLFQLILNQLEAIPEIFRPDGIWQIMVTARAREWLEGNPSTDGV